MSYLRIHQRASATVEDSRGVREILRTYPGAILQTIHVTKPLTPAQRRRLPAEVRCGLVRVQEVPR